MQVIVKSNCPRCKKETSESMRLEDASELSKTTEAQNKEHQEVIAEIARSLESTEYPAPDVIIAYLDPAGERKVEMFDGLCTSTGSKNRGCASRVQSLIDEIFLRNKKKPSTKKSKEPLLAPPDQG